MQVTVISPNGLHELSGGGLYLRSLVQGLAGTARVRAIRVVSKRMAHGTAVFSHERVSEISLDKNRARDVAARVALRPTFLGTYQGVIARSCADADVVFLHNTRCGGILRRLQRRYPDKKFVVVSDNVEADLHRQRSQGWTGPRGLLARIETHAVRTAEAWCRHADALSFITRLDAELYAQQYGAPAEAAILPVTVKAPDGPLETAGPPTVLFTGHFGFAPNVDSLRIFAQVAREVNAARPPAGRIAFVAAGADLKKLAPEPVAGLAYHDSPSVAQMDALFRSATCYLAPVRWGSGMKTKVAEALSYGLPVVALPNAGVGYEALRDDPDLNSALDVVEREQDLSGRVLAHLGEAASQRRAVALEAYRRLYSAASQARRLEALLARLRA